MKNILSRHPILAIFLSGFVFYGLLNLLFQFHISADDFTYQENFWRFSPHPSLFQVVDVHMAIRQPIYILQYALMCLSPHATNSFYFLFQLIHALNSVLVFLLIKKLIVPVLEQRSDKKEWTEESGTWLALAGAVFFLIYPNNFEVLYWRSCLFYSLGLTCILTGVIWFSWWSVLAWLLGFVFYESFLFFPLVLLVPLLMTDFLSPTEKTLARGKKIIGVYVLAIAVYGLLRISLSSFYAVELARYPIELGFLGWKFVARLLWYIGFHLSISSSSKEYELLSWLFRFLLLFVGWQYRVWLSANKRLLFILLGVYAATLIPVSLIAHTAPRGSFGSSVIFCVLLAVFMARAPRMLTGVVLVLFVLGQWQGAKKADANSRLYEQRKKQIISLVAELPDGEPAFVEVNDFKKGYRKEWFLQAGFSLKVIQYELATLYPTKKFDLVETCPAGHTCRSLDFSKNS